MIGIGKLVREPYMRKIYCRYIENNRLKIYVLPLVVTVLWTVLMILPKPSAVLGLSVNGSNNNYVIFKFLDKYETLKKLYAPLPEIRGKMWN